MPWRVGKNDPECFWAVNEPDAGPPAPPDRSTGSVLYPGQLLHPHVYVSKALEWLLAHPGDFGSDGLGLEELAARLEERVRTEWSARRVGAMSTEDILAALGTIGIRLDAGVFRGLAAGFMSAIDLAEAGIGIPESVPEPYDEDFVWKASVELWRRLLPERPCVEMVEEELVDGYLCANRDRTPELIAHWEAAWSLLARAAPVQAKSLEFAEVALTGRSTCQLLVWCDDFEEVLEMEALEDRPFAGNRLAFCTGFLKRFPESDGERLLRMKKAVGETHAIMGDRRGADRTFEALAEDLPNDPSVLVAWGDSYWMVQVPGPGGWPASDLDRAEELYRRALGMDGADRALIEEQLEELSETRDEEKEQ